jgi:hypothetical protein
MDIRQSDEADRQKIHAPLDALAQNETVKQITDAINGISDELNSANQQQVIQSSETQDQQRQSLDELKRMRENQESQQIMNIGK